MKMSDISERFTTALNERNNARFRVPAKPPTRRRHDDIVLNMSDEELKERGLKPAQLRSLVAALSKCGRRAEKMGVTIFACSGSGELMVGDEHAVENIIANLDGNMVWDGGDY